MTPRALILIPAFALATPAWAGEIHLPDLWAGHVTATMERFAAQPCVDGFAMTQGDLFYGDWARQRATVTNLCFEVWMPGVTDRENPDFWRVLDVRVHYRWQWQGEWHHAYVNSLDRVGNNRRYVFDLRPLDPFGFNDVGSHAPYRVLQVSANDPHQVWGESVAEMYITVNGHVLNKDDGWNFHVKFQGYKYVP